MAIFTEIGVAFDNKRQGEVFLEFINKQNLTLKSGKNIPIASSLKQRKDGVWTLLGAPEGMSLGTPKSDWSLLKPPLYDEIREFFLDIFKKAPDFKYGYFGGEAHDFICYDDEFEKDVKDGNYPEDFIMSNKAYKDLGEPEGYEKFKPGYMWT